MSYCYGRPRCVRPSRTETQSLFAQFTPDCSSHGLGPKGWIRALLYPSQEAFAVQAQGYVG